MIIILIANGLRYAVGCGYGWHVGDCGVHVVGKISKDIGMGVRKGTVVSFVPTLFGCFLGIKMFFCYLFQLFFWGVGVEI